MILYHLHRYVTRIPFRECLSAAANTALRNVVVNLIISLATRGIIRNALPAMNR